MNIVIRGATLLALIASPAFAQSAGSQSQSGANLQNQPGTASQVPSNSQSSTDSKGPAAAQKIKEDLQNAGFTNVQVVAKSFVVQAKSKNGDPVLMTIGPHGMSVFEAMETNGGGSTGTAPGGASSTTGMNSGTGTNTTSGGTSGSVDSQANSANSIGTGASTSPSTNDTSTDQNNRR